MRQYLKILCEISISKTLYFNLRYFGLKQGIKCPVLVARNMILQRMQGEVVLKSFRCGRVRLGFSGFELFDRKAHRGIWDNRGTVYFDGFSFIGHGTRIVNYGEITFGDKFSVSAGAEIVCGTSITFGKEVLISWNTLIMDADFHKIYNTEKLRVNKDCPIVIGDHVWIGCRCTILKGANIPRGSVIAASSVITHKFTDPCTVIGGQNSVLKRNIEWEF